MPRQLLECKLDREYPWKRVLFLVERVILEFGIRQSPDLWWHVLLLSLSNEYSETNERLSSDEGAGTKALHSRFKELEHGSKEPKNRNAIFAFEQG